jgi:hypothetical protein
MFKSFTGLELRADALIRSYQSWADGVLLSLTDTTNATRFVGELRVLASHIESYAKQARAVMAAEGFADLDPAIRDDVLAIAEEGEQTGIELAEEVDPNKKWAGLDEQVKQDLTARTLADPTAVARLRARARMEVRAAKAQPQPPAKKK